MPMRNNTAYLRQETIRLLTHWGELTEQAESMGDSVITKPGGSRGQAKAIPLMKSRSRDFDRTQRLLGLIGDADRRSRGFLEAYARTGCSVGQLAKDMEVSPHWVRQRVDPGLLSFDVLILSGA